MSIIDKSIETERLVVAITVAAKSYGVSFRGNESVIKLDNGDSCAIRTIY